MIPFLGTDLTNDKKNERINGQEFLVAKPSDALKNALEKSAESVMEVFEKSELSSPLSTVQFICGAVGAVLMIGIFNVWFEGEVSLAQAYQNAPWLFLLGGGCLIVWAILKILSYQKQKCVMENKESEKKISKLDRISEEIYAELKVPEDALEVEILSFCYKIKNDTPKAYTKGISPTPFDNFEYKIFKDSEHLYIADFDGKYSFPLTSFRAIRTIKKNIAVPTWNKETEPNKGIYKEYKLTVDNYECVHMKKYHILEFENNGEILGIYFPCYELPVFEKMTGMKAE